MWINTPADNLIAYTKEMTMTAKSEAEFSSIIAATICPKSINMKIEI